MILDKLKAALPAHHSSDQHLLALDIGTEFVKALIARIEGDELKIIGVGRAHQELSDMHSGAIADIGGVVRNCELALSDAEAQAGLQAKQVVIGIAGQGPYSDDSLQTATSRQTTRHARDGIYYRESPRARPGSRAERDWLGNRQSRGRDQAGQQRHRQYSY
jgi:hypothetical protein